MNINDVLIIKENIIDYKYKFPTIDLLIDINTDTNHHKYKHFQLLVQNLLLQIHQCLH